MDSASPNADRIVGCEHVRTQAETTLAEKFFATSWTGALDGSKPDTH